MPQGRGKLERLFGTITSELLCGLPGWLAPGSARPATAPALSLAEVDGAIGRFLVEDYSQRAHSETKVAPVRRWAAGGWLPRMPESLEQLDMLLLRVARPRVVHRDGIHFEGQRYLALTLAAWVGETVTIRYDPRDLAKIGVYYHDRFVCRAVSPELAAQTISLKDLQAARSARRRQLAAQLAGRREHAHRLLAAAPYPADRIDTMPATAAAPRARRRLALYREE
ncbi:MAG: Mu transposase C-terminal domain-containing protein [Actinobacteria bacterium]|nr:Mu transposase C-terminal domain-containing protein [Actinomycetota bacterium]